MLQACAWNGSYYVGPHGGGPYAWLDLMVVSDGGWIVNCTLTIVECGGFVEQLDIFDTSGEIVEDIEKCNI